MTNSRDTSLRRLLKLNRILPYITVLGAAVAIVLSFLGIISLSIADNIIIALLALIAIDSLTERISILERIEARIHNYSSQRTLIKSRSDIIPLEEQAKNASEIFVVGVSGASIMPRYFDFFYRKLNEGCVIRVVLVNPQSPSLEVFKRQTLMRHTEKDIEGVLANFEQLVFPKSPLKGQCALRLLDVFVPFSIFAVDLQKDSGTMIVEYRPYKRNIGNLLHFFLEASRDSYWFSFYREQAEQIWSEAIPWILTSDQNQIAS